MTNKKILPSLLKINIITLFFLFLSVMIFNVNMAMKIRNFDTVSANLHDFADLSQYAITLVLQIKSLKEGESSKKYLTSISGFEKELMERLEKRKKDFLKIYPLATYDSLVGSMKNMLSLNKFLVEKKSMQTLLDELEDTYINILTFSNKHNKLVEEFFLARMKIFVSLLSILILIVLFLLNKKIREIISPLKTITLLSQELSISQNDKKEDIDVFDRVYDYSEYQILANSLKDMHQRIHVENRMSSHESAASSISNFAENLAHSINNPLAIIATSVKILNKKAKKVEDEYTIDESQLILNEIQRITEITHQMKSLIHTTTKSEAELFKANNLITNINLLFFNKLFEKNIRFNYDRNINLNILAKEDILNQMLATIFENAVMYNDAAKPIIDLIFEETDTNIKITLRDNGSAPSIEKIHMSFEGKTGLSTLGLYTSSQCGLQNGYELIYNAKPIKEFMIVIPKTAKKELTNAS